MPKVLAILAVILAVLPLPSTHAQGGKVGGNPPNYHPQREASQTSQRGTENFPLVVDVKDRQQSSAEAAESKRKEEEEPRRKSLELILTAVIALAAIGQVAGVFVQASINHRQRLAYERSERAWLGSSIYQPSAEQMDIRNLQANGAVPITVTIENLGKTPARLVDSAMRTDIVDAVDQKSVPVKPKLPSERTYRIKEHPSPLIAEVGTVWMPQQKFVYQSVVPKSFFEKHGLDAWEISDKLLCVYGFVEYDDAFGERHVTRFCYAYERITTPYAFSDTKTGEPLFPPSFSISGPPSYNEAT
jgi:hypothetical protein